MPFRVKATSKLGGIILGGARWHIAANLGIGPDDFEYAPFAQEVGLGRAHRLFPEGLQPIIRHLNMALVASLGGSL